MCSDFVLTEGCNVGIDMKQCSAPFNLNSTCFLTSVLVQWMVSLIIRPLKISVFNIVLTCR